MIDALTPSAPGTTRAELASGGQGSSLEMCGQIVGDERVNPLEDATEHYQGGIQHVDERSNAHPSHRPTLATPSRAAGSPA